jgi:hypothetical protein
MELDKANLLCRKIVGNLEGSMVRQAFLMQKVGNVQWPFEKVLMEKKERIEISVEKKFEFLMESL